MTNPRFSLRDCAVAQRVIALSKRVRASRKAKELVLAARKVMPTAQVGRMNKFSGTTKIRVLTALVDKIRAVFVQRQRGCCARPWASLRLVAMAEFGAENAELTEPLIPTD